MAQITSGIRRILSLPSAYNALQKMLGADQARRDMCADHIRASPGQSVVDVGCGTAIILDYLPRDITYFGFDLSPEYIAAAVTRYGSRGTFSCKDVTMLPADDLPPCNIAMALGVLHHLDDVDATNLLEVLHGRLAPGGRLVTADPAYWTPQSHLARFVISRDRGRNVRTGEAYKALVPPAYSNVELFRRDNLLNIPYTHAVMELTK